MIGTLINVATIAVGSVVGATIKSRLNPRFAKVFFQAAGLLTLFLGVTMSLKTEHIPLLCGSLIGGMLVGELLRLDVLVDRLGNALRRRLRVGNDARFTEGLITAFLLFCVGAMAVLGPVEEGMTGQLSSTLLTKAVMDGVSSIMLASAMGWGILFSAIPVFLFQGSLTLLAMLFGSIMPEQAIVEITAVGGVMLIGLGLQILEVTNIKVVNMLPALVIAGVIAALI
jgi:uncharacterized membrane protein YqgA involved in biofilm formation